MDDVLRRKATQFIKKMKVFVEGSLRLYPPLRKIENVQTLRALAAVMVVFHHAVGQMESRGGRTFPIDASFGQAGVDLFFVISCFIMFYTTCAAKQSPFQFWRNRIVRIVPIYWFYTLLMALIALAAPSLLKTAQFDLAHVLSSLVFIPTTHPRFGDFIWPVLVQGWTLNYKMFFYLIFGGLLFLTGSLKRVLALGLIFTCLVASGFLIRPSGAIAVTYTNPLLLEFLIGVLIGVVFVHGPRPGAAVGWGLLALGIVLFAGQAFLESWFSSRVLVWGVPASLVLTGSVALEGRWWRFGGIQELGNASYSLYLNHTFTLGAIGVVWARIGDGSPIFDIAMFLFALFASVFGGVLGYSFLEKPLSAAFKKRSG